MGAGTVVDVKKLYLLNSVRLANKYRRPRTVVTGGHPALC